MLEARTQSTSAALASVAATQAIGNVLALHSRGVDRADEQLLARAYHADARVDYGFFDGPARDLIGMLCAARREQPITLHRTSNMWVKVRGSHACSESYVFAYMQDQTGGAAMQRLIGGRYLDLHEARSGRWALTHRRYVLDFNINRAGCYSPQPPAADAAHFAPRGAHGACDPGRTLLAMFHASFSKENSPMTPLQGAAAQLDLVLAHHALHELNMAYARAADRADEDLMASIFHPGATVVTGLFNCSGDEYAREVTQFVRQNLARCFHSIANEWFDIRGDRAVGECYVIAAITAGATDVLTAGRYIDQYERRDGVWKIMHRAFVEDWSSAQPTSHESTGLYASLTTRGCFGKQDPVYAFWGN